LRANFGEEGHKRERLVPIYITDEFCSSKYVEKQYYLKSSSLFNKIKRAFHNNGGIKLINNDKLQRINELAKKAKSDGLSLKEQQEQKKLREEYLKNFRNSFKNQLTSVKVVDEEGTDVTPEKLKHEKDQNSHKGPLH